MRFRSILALLLTTLAVAGCGEERSHRAQQSHPVERTESAPAAAGVASRDGAQIRDVIRRFNRAALAGDSSAMCALVDPAKLRYLEQIGQRCEDSLGGTLTRESERDVRSITISSIEIRGDNAVAQLRAASGARDLSLRRTEGDWLIVGV